MSERDPLGLHAVLIDGGLMLRPMAETDRAALGAACAEDTDIWNIYSTSYGPEHFDANFDAMLADLARLAFTVLVDGELAGMTSWLDISPRHRRAEIGTTYLRPKFRGCTVNPAMKRLLFAHGFACGLKRISLNVDTRNLRSQAACRKVGATFEGVLRNHMITWTGHERDTAIFSVVEGDRERLGL